MAHGVFAMVVSATRKLPAAPWPSVRIPEKVMPNISPSAIVGSEKLASAQSNRRQSAAAGAPPGGPGQGEEQGVEGPSPSTWHCSMETEIGQAVLFCARPQCGAPGYWLRFQALIPPGAI